MLNRLPASFTMRAIYEAETEGATKEDKKAAKENLKSLDEDNKKVDIADPNSIKKNKYSLKVLLKLYEMSLAQLRKIGPNGPPINVIMESKGDITKLGPRAEYYKLMRNILLVHANIVKAMTEKESKYIKIFETLLDYTEKSASKFKKAFSLDHAALVKALYITNVIYIFEMGTIIAANTAHVLNKNSHDFDTLLEKTKDYVKIFQFGEALYADDELNQEELMKQEFKMKEDIDCMDQLDEYIMEAFGKPMGGSTKNTDPESIGFNISKISRLLNFGLSVTLYKLFNIIRFIIYVYNYTKYTFMNKLDLINNSLEMMDIEDGTQRTAKSEIVKQSSMNYRTDMIESSNKAQLDIDKEFAF